MTRARTVMSLILLTASGCMFGTLKTNLDEMDEHGEIRGEVSAENWNGSPLVVGLLKLAEVDGAPDHPYDKAELHGPGESYFIVVPGRYRVVAYEDTNSNFRWDEEEGERIAAYADFTVIDMHASERREHVDVRITHRQLRSRPEVAHEHLRRRNRSAGEVVALDDPRFAPSTGPKGLWAPIDFLEDPGWGVFQLQPYEEGKIPVLFVHGISGYPQEFTRLIAGLDRERFQPWVLQYPSGIELGLASDALDRVLNEVRHRVRYEHMCLVAHSMGGVLSRLFLKRHRTDELARCGETTATSEEGASAESSEGSPSADSAAPAP